MLWGVPCVTTVITGNALLGWVASLATLQPAASQLTARSLASEVSLAISTLVKLYGMICFDHCKRYNSLCSVFFFPFRGLPVHRPYT